MQGDGDGSAPSPLRLHDPFWEAAIDLKLPLSFHILTSRSDTPGADHVRGPKLNSAITQPQMMITSGVRQLPMPGAERILSVVTAMQFPPWLVSDPGGG